MKMHLIIRAWTLMAAAAILLPWACTTSTSPQPQVLTEEERSNYLEKGQQLASLTFQNLSGQLRKALEEKGVPGAVQYCQSVATPLVDSLSQVYGAQIRRSSFKVRNPANRPQPHEKAALDIYQNEHLKGNTLQPRVVRLDSTEVAFYAPIMVQPLCLKCHGKLGESLKESDYAVIQDLYPDDKAIGYNAGDWRGMWSIVFEE